MTPNTAEAEQNEVLAIHEAKHVQLLVEEDAMNVQPKKVKRKRSLAEATKVPPGANGMFACDDAGTVWPAMPTGRGETRHGVGAKSIQCPLIEICCGLGSIPTTKKIPRTYQFVSHVSQFRPCLI